MRSSGILMPIFSLPGKYGIGTLGKKAYEFVDFLKEAGQTYWQILPINPTTYGNSPYCTSSSFAGNPNFIDFEMLAEDGYLNYEDFENIDFGSDCTKVDYEKLTPNKTAVLKKAYEAFKTKGILRVEFFEFVKKQEWLKPFSVYMTAKENNGFVAHYEFSEKIGRADFDKYLSENSEKCEYYMFVQFVFYRQWFKLKKYANENGIKIIGDIPFYVPLDSAEVFSEPEQFDLDANYVPNVVSGCPPDAFSSKGQLWGTPVYNFKRMKEDGYYWWKKRIGFAFKIYDVVRIDHFRAFEAYYTVKYGEENAVNGKWVKGPGIDFFNELKSNFGQELPIIAEDLGLITEEVRELLKECNFPGMKVLQFAFNTDCESDYLPHKYDKNCVVYTGTHDNDTIIGWHNKADRGEISFAEKYMNYKSDEGFNWAFIRLAMASVADTAIFTMQDFLGLDSNARINIPSTVGGNWNWRITDGCTNSWLAKIIYDMTALYYRTKKG